MDRRGDYAPYAFKSTDYGKTWTRIVNGLRAGEPVRVVREDPERRGLLYAGTETGVYVSFDGGANWQTLSRNLPVVPITDLEVRHGDLYAATEGRAFWALDDLSALRQLSAQVTASRGPPVHAAPGAAGRRAVPGDDERGPQSAVRRERVLLVRDGARLGAWREARVPRRRREGAADVHEHVGRGRRHSAALRSDRRLGRAWKRRPGSTRSSGTCAPSRRRRCPVASRCSAGRRLAIACRRAAIRCDSRSGRRCSRSRSRCGPTLGSTIVRRGSRRARLDGARDQRAHRRDPRCADPRARCEGAGDAVRGSREGCA